MQKPHESQLRLALNTAHDRYSQEQPRTPHLRVQVPPQVSQPLAASPGLESKGQEDFPQGRKGQTRGWGLRGDSRAGAGPILAPVRPAPPRPSVPPAAPKIAPETGGAAKAFPSSDAEVRRAQQFSILSAIFCSTELVVCIELVFISSNMIYKRNRVGDFGIALGSMTGAQPCPRGFQRGVLGLRRSSWWEGSECGAGSCPHHPAAALSHPTDHPAPCPSSELAPHRGTGTRAELHQVPQRSLWAPRSFSLLHRTELGSEQQAKLNYRGGGLELAAAPL